MGAVYKTHATLKITTHMAKEVLKENPRSQPDLRVEEESFDLRELIFF